MSGQWPPEWEDSEEEFLGEDDQLDAEAEAQLSEVAAFLAALPAPAMPDAVEARISAALATEAAALAEHGEHGDPPDGARKLGTSRSRPRAGRHRGGGGPGRDGTGPRRGFRVRPSMAAGSLAACLLLAGLGYGLSRADLSSSSSSSAAAGSAAAPAAGKASSAAASSAAGPEAAPSAAVPGAGHTVSTFAVTVSGTRYQHATLAAQVRAKLTANGGENTFEGTVPAASASAGSAVAGSAGAGSAGAPSPALRGCVLQLTKGVPPRLVDRATYQGEPAYIIASSSRVWVVGPGCTAAKTEVIASVPLAS
jgi:hypothetical protein